MIFSLYDMNIMCSFRLVRVCSYEVVFCTKLGSVLNVFLVGSAY